MKEGTGRILAQLAKYPLGSHKLIIPASVVKDSTYPFKHGEEVLVKIVKDTIVAEKIKRKKSEIKT